MNQWCFLRSLGFLAITFIVSGCGGGNSTTTIGSATTVTLAPTTVSLEFGQVASLTPTVSDAKGNQVLTATSTFQSSNSAIATVSNSGLVCAGSWDSVVTPIVCTPATLAGAANITATAAGITSTPTVVSVHARIAGLSIVPAAQPCTSDSMTAQLFVKAVNAQGADITSTVGPIAWTSTNTNIVNIDVNGLATAKQPGLATIIARAGNVNSLPATFVTCPPKSILLATSDPASPNSVTLAPAATSQLTVTITDTLGNPMPDVTGVVAASSSQSLVATSTAAGLVTAIVPGNTGIVVSCTPLTCNPGGTPVYSNLIAVSVTGASAATTVYVTGANATTIIPIDTSTNVAGTAIAIPPISSTQPIVNSFVFNKAGSRAFIGTNLGMFALDPTVTPNTLSSPVLLPGKVLAVSPDSKKIIIAAQNGTQVYVFDTTSGAFDTLSVGGAATSADFTTDNSKAFIVAGSTLFAYPPANPLASRPLATTASRITFLTQGSAAYLAGGSAPGINVRATCDMSSIADVTVPSAPLEIASSFDSKQVLGVNTANLYDLSVSITSAVCPPSPTNTLTTVALGATPTIINQLVLTPDGTRGFVLSDLTNVLQYNVGSALAPASILLTGGSATTGGMTLDSKNLYVGIKDTNTVQRIDTSSSVAVATAPISVPLGSGISPDFVAVRPK